MKKIQLFLAFASMVALISSCDKVVMQSTNPLLEQWETPFGTPPFDKIKHKHFLPALEEGMKQHNTDIEAIVNNEQAPNFENVILAYDNSGKLLNQVRSIFSLMVASDNSDELMSANVKATPMLSAHSSKIALNEELFAKIKTVYDNRQKEKLDYEQTRLLEKIYNSFVRSGALLQGAEKERMTEINSELSLLSVRFGNNLLSETNDFRLVLKDGDLVGLPSHVRSNALNMGQELGLKDRYVFTLQNSSWIPFLTYSANRELRDELYQAYIMRGNNDNESDNKAIISKIAMLRAEKAALLGYKSWAHYVIDDQMAKEPKAVYELLDKIYEPALAQSERELAEMNKLLQHDHPDAIFQSSDWWYYAEKVRKQKYALDEEMLKPYFTLDAVQKGVFLLSNRLFGVTFRPLPVEHYHEDCQAYEVLDKDNSHIGVLYLDLHARATKRQGAWCGKLRPQRYDGEERIAPIIGIWCNYPPRGRAASAPVYLSLDETATYFHEFGHALHFLFQDVKYSGLGNVEGDFVELPSQIMENWAFEPEFLKQYAHHFRSGTPITDNLIEKLQNSSLFNQGFNTTELAAAALSDLDIHSLRHGEVNTPFDVVAFEELVLNHNRGLINQIEPRYHYTYFRHIFDGGYSAGYYFYLWAEVLDKDAFNAFKESGDLFNRNIAEKFRREILEKGGSRPGMEMYKAFRGKNPSQESMLKARGLK